MPAEVNYRNRMVVKVSTHLVLDMYFDLMAKGYSIFGIANFGSIFADPISRFTYYSQSFMHVYRIIRMLDIYIYRIDDEFFATICIPLLLWLCGGDER